jgi:hypothetical protein
MNMRQFAWKRIVLVVALFALGVAATLYDWHQHPPARGLAGTATHMRNIPGDLSNVLWLYAIEASIAIAALQPWRHHPRRSWIGVGATSFGAWGILRWLVGLHSPPVMFWHDVLMLVVALLLGSSLLVVGSESAPIENRVQVT